MRGIIIDAKSGATGAGRKASEATVFSELTEGIRAYKTAGTHRHIAEIESELGNFAGQALKVTFSPHLCPFTRGILALCYARPSSKDLQAEKLKEAADQFFENAPAVQVRAPGTHLDTRSVRGSARIELSYNIDPRTHTVIAQGALDNLAKGASSQAIQAFNLRFGFDEMKGLPRHALWP